MNPVVQAVVAILVVTVLKSIDVSIGRYSSPSYNAYAFIPYALILAALLIFVKVCREKLY